MWSRRMLSIDPGLNGTGVVYWFDGVPQRAAVLRPLVGQVRSTLKDDEDSLVARARTLTQLVIAVSKAPSTPHTVVIEFPEFHESIKGRMARSTGSIDRLSFLIGVMVGQMPNHWRVMLPLVREWKGQLPKDVVIKRMTQCYGKACVTHLGMKTHAWDALGIGEWAWRQTWMR